MRIAICDDNSLCCEQLALLVAQEEQEPGQFDVQIFSSGEALLQQMQEKQPFDLIFMDIEMGEGLSGMETAIQIRRQNQDVMLVFVTAHIDFVFEAFDVQAMQYLVKPIDVQQFQRVFQLCRRKYFNEECRIPFRIRNEKGQEELLLLMAKELLYVESYLRKLQIHTIYGRSFEVAGKISEMEDLLIKRGFIRSHKSYLINLNYLRLLEADQLLLATKQGEQKIKLPLSRRKKEQVKKAFLQYKREDWG